MSPVIAFPVPLTEAVARIAKPLARARMIGACAIWVPVVNVQTLSLASGVLV